MFLNCFYAFKQEIKFYFSFIYFISYLNGTGLNKKY